MLKGIIIKYKGIILFTIGSLLIVLTVYLGLFSRIVLVKEKVFSEIEMLINTKDDSFNDENIIIDAEIDINTGFIDSENSNDDGNDIIVSDEDISASKDDENKKKYIGYLVIPKINLNYGFVDKDSYYNNVNRNIQVISISDYPNVDGGNFIIAGHSGTSEVSYFKSLYRLKIGDIAKVIYQNNTYTYKIVSIYKEIRDGSVNIKRNTTKTTLTLITCSYKDREHQTIYIAELDNIKGE